MGLNVVCSCGSIFRVIMNQGPFNDTKTYIARCPSCGVTHTATEFEFPTIADFMEHLYILYKWRQKGEGGRGMKKVTMTKELAMELLDIRIIGIMNTLSEWKALGDTMPDDMREELETNLALYSMAYDAISGSTSDADTEVCNRKQPY